MKLMLLGLLAVVYAKPERFDQPCDPSVTDCPRSETSRQNSCGKYGILKIGNINCCTYSDAIKF